MGISAQGEFADDVVLLACSQQGVAAALCSSSY